VKSGSFPIRPGRNIAVLYRKTSEDDTEYLNDGYEAMRLDSFFEIKSSKFNCETYFLKVQNPNCDPVSKQIYLRGRSVVVHYSGDNGPETAVEEILDLATVPPQKCPADLEEDAWLNSTTVDAAMERITPYCMPRTVLLLSIAMTVVKF